MSIYPNLHQVEYNRTWATLLVFIDEISHFILAVWLFCLVCLPLLLWLHSTDPCVYSWFFYLCKVWYGSRTPTTWAFPLVPIFTETKTRNTVWLCLPYHRLPPEMDQDLNYKSWIPVDEWSTLGLAKVG